MTSSLLIGGIIFSEMDQTDFTCPFEVLSRVPGSKFLVIAKTPEPVRDMKGLILTPEFSFADTPALDVLLVPGGSGVNALMEDPITLDFIRKQAAHAKLILTVCTGALIFGATGLLKGRRATTHWASRHMLPSLGAILQEERVVQDGNLITTAGVTAGLDGALLAASVLCGEDEAKAIQLYLEYAPNPPFHSGTPDTAPPAILKKVQTDYINVVKAREQIIERLTTSKAW
ncbi:MAG: DJ-1/PfpI family protein [Chthoniobacterales bacterium]